METFFRLLETLHLLMQEAQAPVPLVLAQKVHLLRLEILELPTYLVSLDLKVNLMIHDVLSQLHERYGVRLERARAFPTYLVCLVSRALTYWLPHHFLQMLLGYLFDPIFCFWSHVTNHSIYCLPHR